MPSATYSWPGRADNYGYARGRKDKCWSTRTSRAGAHVSGQLRRATLYPAELRAPVRLNRRNPGQRQRACFCSIVGGGSLLRQSSGVRIVSGAPVIVCRGCAGQIHCRIQSRHVGHGARHTPGSPTGSPCVGNALSSPGRLANSVAAREFDQDKLLHSPRRTIFGRFSNRPFGVKHFQTIHHCSVDVVHGLVLLFGIGTKALPVWDSRTRRNNLLGGLTVRRTAGPSDQANSPHPSSREGHLSTAGWNSNFLLSALIRYGCHAATAACSRVQRNSVPSTQMRCRITASRRARATIAFLIPRRLAICIAHALSQDHFLERIMA